MTIAVVVVVSLLVAVLLVVLFSRTKKETPIERGNLRKVEDTIPVPTQPLADLLKDKPIPPPPPPPVKKNREKKP